MLRSLFIVALLFPLLAFAQGDNIEINLDTLQVYTPPPMFDGTPPTAEKAKPSRSVAIISKPKFVPVPMRKPRYSGPLIGRNDAPMPEIEEAQIVLQTAQDILRQIEGDTEPVEPPAVQAAPASPPPRLEPVRVKDKSSMNHAETFELILPFKLGETRLSKEHETLLLQQIVIRLQKYDDVQLEVRAFASSEEQQESPARRLSLARALAVRDFLNTRNIPRENIYLRPLGRAETANSDYVELIVSRI